MTHDNRLKEDGLIDDISVPDNLVDIIRASVYPSLREMPKEERRAQRVSFIMGMLPKGVDMTHKQVEEFIDSHYG